MYKFLANTSVKFQINIPNGCWENSKKLYRSIFLAAPCTYFCHSWTGRGTNAACSVVCLRLL